MTTDVELRDVTESDLPIFFEQQRDPDANHMAAFSAKDPNDRVAFMAKWARIRADERVVVKTIVVDGRVAGSVFTWVDEALGEPEVSYWLGKAFWGKGIATKALRAFLAQVVTARPVYGRAAKDNVASLRVLEKCGFVRCGEDRGYANARGEEIDEAILVLR